MKTGLITSLYFLLITDVLGFQVHHHHFEYKSLSSLPHVPQPQKSSTTKLSASSSSNLPSAYDISLPASLRGEAVRSALKSDRGTCYDFTSTTFPPYFNVGMIQVTGRGTANFLNTKLTNSFPEKVDDSIMTTTQLSLSPMISVQTGLLKEGCLVTSKGRLIDKLTVLSFDSGSGRDGNNENSLESYVVTSPGHYGSMLFDRLDPFIFPLDGVKLHDLCPTENNNMSGTTKSKIFTLIATKLENAKSSLQKNMLPILNQYGFTDDTFLSFPKNSQESLRYVVKDNDGELVFEMLLYEQTTLTKCCCSGYTVVITEKSHTNIGSGVWGNLIDPNNFEGPVELGPLEYETLRIEAGVPAFGHEITGGLSDDDDDDDDDNAKRSTRANASPLELYLDNMVDEEKGCYQGQEAIAAQLNNKRGIPRNLYTVIFPEEDNFFDFQQDEEQYSNHAQRLSNKTKQPKAGMDIFVLGSNEEIKVGTLTSVAEKDGTSNSETVALGLVRRSDGILRKMEHMGIDKASFGEIMEEDPFWADGYSALSDGSGIIQPPSLDPLDGLEVVLKDSFTQGYLRPLPVRRLKDNNMFETDAWKASEEFQDEPSSVMGFIPEETDLNFESKAGWEEEPTDVDDVIVKEDKKSEEIALEAQRKDEKMELLKQRAEEVMKRRRQKKESQESTTNSLNDDADAQDAKLSAAEAEAERKEKKMKMLKERAEAAMKRRREKKA